MIKHLKNLIETKTDFSIRQISKNFIEISFSNKNQSINLDDSILSINEFDEISLININTIEEITYKHRLK